MTREEITEILKSEGKQFIFDILIRLLDSDTIDITDINVCYVNSLKKKINEKENIIKEADNCIFNSLFYDSVGKVDSSNVILDKVRWRYRYADTNKDALCKAFNYDPEKDKLV